MTRETVWWETPARAATSDMTRGRDAPSGCTVLPPRGARGPPRRRRAPGQTSTGRRGPGSARRAGAPLVEDVEGDGKEQHQALDHRLDRLVDAHERHAVAHHTHE